MATDVSTLIERVEAFEARAGVCLKSLGAELNPLYDDVVHLNVRGELHPQSGTELSTNIELIVAAYDTSSKVVGTESHRFESEGFFGFEIFDITIEIHVNNLSRIRILPKQGD